MSKILAALVAAMFAVVTTGSFAAAHAGGAPAADGKTKSEMKKSDKPAKKKAKKAKKSSASK